MHTESYPAQDPLLINHSGICSKQLAAVDIELSKCSSWESLANHAIYPGSFFWRCALCASRALHSVDFRNYILYP